MAASKRSPGPAVGGQTLLVGAPHVIEGGEDRADRLGHGQVAGQLLVADPELVGPLDQDATWLAWPAVAGLVGQVPEPVAEVLGAAERKGVGVGGVGQQGSELGGVGAAQEVVLLGQTLQVLLGEAPVGHRLPDHVLGRGQLRLDGPQLVHEVVHRLRLGRHPRRRLSLNSLVLLMVDTSMSAGKLQSVAPAQCQRCPREGRRHSVVTSLTMVSGPATARHRRMGLRP